MKVGLFITNQQTLDTDMVSALDDQFAMVRLARDCGWDSLFSGQHYLNGATTSSCRWCHSWRGSLLKPAR